MVKAARGVGAGGALIYSQRGVGIRERVGVLGIAIDTEKDVVSMLLGSDQAKMVANAIYAVGSEAELRGNVCGYFSATADRKAHGCYAEISG